MKILYYDCFSGISGDMNLGAMIDLGVDPEYLTSELKKLNMQGYSVTFKPDQRKGITGTRAEVIIEESENPSSNYGNDETTFHSHQHAHPHNHDQTQNHTHNHDHPHNQIHDDSHSHDHTHSHDHGHPHDHTHSHSYNPVHQPERNFLSIKDLIENSALKDEVKQLSIEIFKKIAVAEAHVHGKTVEEIHFHEVGALDSIIDIVGAAICFNYLKPDKVISSPVQLGGGTVHCAHGIFPVPAPATTEILIDKPVRLGAVNVETTTPTGAAIISTFAAEFTDKPHFKINKIGYGIGHRDNEIPNVLRVCLAESIDSQSTEQALMIECNLDDMNPELYEYVMEKIFLAGADDVFFQPVVMKKTRPATKISVLCKIPASQEIKNILLTETSTLGVREYTVNKTVLQRNWKLIQTPWGEVRVKQGILNGKVIKSKPEYEDCLKISIENNIPLNVVINEVLKINNS